ncbi:MAG: DNA/RNA nuclease SfsA, partial [Gammaproteobacteria bacterium]
MTTQNLLLAYEPVLERAALIRRYKRFLADVETGTGEVLTIHCPNTGSMKGLAEPGTGVWFSTSDNPKRKYRHTWELAEPSPGVLACVHTGRPNTVLCEALRRGMIGPLADYDEVIPEQVYAESCRADALLRKPGLPDAVLEIKNVTLLEHGQGYFPDAVSARAKKHLNALAEVARSGRRAVLLYAVSHDGIESVAPAAHIDPGYARALADARRAG